MADPGFEIYRRFYPMPQRFRLCDPVLVREVTGMEWPEFVDGLERMEANGDEDQVVIAGLAAVAFWQGNQSMSRDKVRRHMERTMQEDVVVVGVDEDDSDEDGDGDVRIPPAEAAGTPPSSSPESRDSADASSAGTNPSDFGHQG